ncbi:hypothetical protein [Pedobacter duraquae]|uniref:Pectate lyase-like protein n=1 Tax=Pedobacter duraquae TaxID=425511 RepID=A0A4R6IIU0_9SPHI|nr:hypothetical protein [Pedobacter duraquae]TDO21845.1 hypothetical protein CLV32_2953 [Pedobacter duraquae]
MESNNDPVIYQYLKIEEELNIPIGDSFSANEPASLKKKLNGRLALDGEEMQGINEKNQYGGYPGFDSSSATSYFQNTVGDITFNVINEATGESLSYKTVFGVTDFDVDGVYIKKETTGSNAGRYLKLDLKNGFLKAKYYGVKGDGISDDTESLRNALISHSKYKVPLFFDEGLYIINHNNWTSSLELNYVNVIGVGNDFSKIKVDSRVFQNFIKLTDNSICILHKIAIGGFLNVIFSEDKVCHLSISKCKFFNNREFSVYVKERTMAANSEVVFANLSDNLIENSSGFALQGLISKSAIATGNQMYNVQRDLTLWDISNGYRVQGICIGDLSNAEPDYGQNLTTQIIISNNTIEKLTNQSPVGSSNYYSTNAIAASGRNVIISNNAIKALISSRNDDVEAIYTKMVEGVVGFNTIEDGTMGNSISTASIAIKGVRIDNPTNLPACNNIQVIGNVLLNKTGNTGCVGIQIYGGSNIEVSNNTADGFLYAGMRVLGGKNISLTRNNILNMDASQAITSELSSIDGYLRIENNNISDIRGTNSTTALQLIKVTASVTSITDLKVIGNHIYISLDNTKYNTASLIAVDAVTGINRLSCHDNEYIILSSNSSTNVNLNGLNIRVVNSTGFAKNISVSNNRFKTDVPLVNMRHFTINGSANIADNSSLVPNLQLGINYNNGVEYNNPFKRIAPDASFTVTQVDKYITLSSIAASRIVTLPSANSCLLRTIILHNINTSSFAWGVTPGIRDYSGNLYSLLDNKTIYMIQSDGTAWYIMSKQGPV